MSARRAAASPRAGLRDCSSATVPLDAEKTREHAMRASAVILIAACVLLSFPCTGQSAETQVLSGAGTTSCGKYLARGEDKTFDRLFVSWAQGFLSGMNMATYRLINTPFLALPDGDSIIAYLDKYCRDNPLKSPVEGAIQLFGELRPAK